MQTKERSEKQARTPVQPGVCLYPVGNGYAAEGRGFYVWDEDRSEVIRAVRELARGGRAVPRTRRMLRIELGPDQETVT